MSNNRVFRILTTVGFIIFSLLVFVLIYLKNVVGIGPGLIAAGPCLSAACVCRALQLWNTDRKKAIFVLLYAVFGIAAGILFIFI